jgi:aldose 1-epimerase
LEKITLKTAHIHLEVLTYGAIIQKLLVKNKENEFTNVVLGFEDPEEYVHANPNYFGACIGQYAGRINQGSFTIDKTNYQLDCENGPHLHGGNSAFSKQYWKVEEVNRGKDPFVILSLDTADFSSPYPGDLKVFLSYQLAGKELKISYSATTNKATIINLTNHSYFNLGGKASLNTHELKINASQFLELNLQLVPTGKLKPVQQTSKNFTEIKKLGEVCLDDCLILDKNDENAAYICCEETAIAMQIKTNQPAIVIYRPLAFEAICFETQNYPDAPNHSHFPSAVLHPHESYQQETSFIFSVL